MASGYKSEQCGHRIFSSPEEVLSDNTIVETQLEFNLSLYIIIIKMLWEYKIKRESWRQLFWLEDRLRYTLNYLLWEVLVSSEHPIFVISIILKTIPSRPGKFSDTSYIIDSGSGNLYGNCFAEALIHFFNI